MPQLRRHLRKLYTDPVTGRAEWGLLYQPGSNRIIGVHSLSQMQPLKVGNFEARFKGFEDKSHLSDWQFMQSVQVAHPVSAGQQRQKDELTVPPVLFPR